MYCKLKFWKDNVTVIYRGIGVILLALVCALVFLSLFSQEPIFAFYKLIFGPLEKVRYVGNVVETMIPLIFTGLGVGLMFKANQINLGSEGAFHLGGLVASIISLYVMLPFGINQTIAIIIGGIAGSFVTAIPAVLKLKANSNEMITSLLINYVVLYFSNFVLYKIIKDASIGGASAVLPDANKLPIIIPGTRIHIGLLIALAAIFIAYFIIEKTIFGYELKITGDNEKFALTSGISVAKVALLSQLVGGFLAGIGGAIEILGPVYSRYSWSGFLGYGWDGIVIATICKNNPRYVLVGAFIIAYLRTGAAIMSRATYVGAEIVMIIQGIVIIAITAKGVLRKGLLRNA